MACETLADWSVVTMGDTFTMRHLGDVRRQLDALTDAGRMKIALDMSQTRIVDSSAISLLVNVHQKLQKKGGRLVVLKPSDAVKSVFSVISFELIMPVYHSRSAFDSDVSAGRL